MAARSEFLTETWYYSREQIENTPSRKYGVDQEKELSYRQQAANLIQDMGQRLTVNQLCINTGIVYMHRFYMVHSFTKFHRNVIAPACLFLGAKVEEQPRKLEHVVRVAYACLNRDTQQQLNPKTELYSQLAQELVINESIILQTLGFEIAVDHPHTHVVKCTQLIRASKDLSQTSYFMATNSLHLTTFCLRYKPTAVACACIHLSAKWSKMQIPKSSDGKNFWEYVDRNMTLPFLDEITREFIQIIESSPNRLKRKLTLKAQQTDPVSKSKVNENASTSSSSTSIFDDEPGSSIDVSQLIDQTDGDKTTITPVIPSKSSINLNEYKMMKEKETKREREKERARQRDEQSSKHTNHNRLLEHGKQKDVSSRTDHPAKHSESRTSESRSYDGQVKPRDHRSLNDQVKHGDHMWSTLHSKTSESLPDASSHRSQGHGDAHRTHDRSRVQHGQKQQLHAPVHGDRSAKPSSKDVRPPDHKKDVRHRHHHPEKRPNDHHKNPRPVEDSRLHTSDQRHRTENRPEHRQLEGSGKVSLPKYKHLQENPTELKVTESEQKEKTDYILMKPDSLVEMDILGALQEECASPHIPSPHIPSPHIPSTHIPSPHIPSPHIPSPHIPHPAPLDYKSKDVKDRFKRDMNVDRVPDHQSLLQESMQGISKKEPISQQNPSKDRRKKTGDYTHEAKMSRVKPEQVKVKPEQVKVKPEQVKVKPEQVMVKPEQVMVKPVPEQVKVRPVPEQVKVRPVPEQVKPRPVPEQVKPRPVPEQVKARPVPEQVKARPVPEQVMARPVPEQVKARPVPEQVKARPVPEQVKARPVPEQVKARPVPEQVKARPVPEQVKARPVPEQVKARPVPEHAKVKLESPRLKKESIKVPHDPMKSKSEHPASPVKVRKDAHYQDSVKPKSELTASPVKSRKDVLQSPGKMKKPRISSKPVMHATSTLDLSSIGIMTNQEPIRKEQQKISPSKAKREHSDRTTSAVVKKETAVKLDFNYPKLVLQKEKSEPALKPVAPPKKRIKNMMQTQSQPLDFDPQHLGVPHRAEKQTSRPAPQQIPEQHIPKPALQQKPQPPLQQVQKPVRQHKPEQPAQIAPQQISQALPSFTNPAIEPWSDMMHPAEIIDATDFLNDMNRDMSHMEDFSLGTDLIPGNLFDFQETESTNPVQMPVSSNILEQQALISPIEPSPMTKKKPVQKTSLEVKRTEPKMVHKAIHPAEVLDEMNIAPVKKSRHKKYVAPVTNQIEFEPHPAELFETKSAHVSPKAKEPSEDGELVGDESLVHPTEIENPALARVRNEEPVVPSDHERMSSDHRHSEHRRSKHKQEKKKKDKDRHRSKDRSSSRNREIHGYDSRENSNGNEAGPSDEQPTVVLASGGGIKLKIKLGNSFSEKQSSPSAGSSPLSMKIKLPSSKREYDGKHDKERKKDKSMRHHKHKSHKRSHSPLESSTADAPASPAKRRATNSSHNSLLSLPMPPADPKKKSKHSLNNSNGESPAGNVYNFD